MNRHIVSILLASGFLFSSGCLTAISTTSFEKPKKSKEALSSTNFRLNNCSSAGVAKHLRELETRQNHSLVPVPYNVYVSVDHDSSTQGQPWKALSVLTLTVFPMWDVDRWTYRMNTEVGGTEPCVVQGRRTETCLMGWLALPFGIVDVVFGGTFDNGHPLLARDGDIDKKIADSVFRALSEERYRKGFAHMAQEARSRLLKGETLSDTDERLLSELPEDAEILAARVKNTADVSKSRETLQKISGEDELVDIALHAKSPQIRMEAAKRVTGLSEDRFAGLVRESRDFDVGTIFLSKVTSEDLLRGIVEDGAALIDNRSAALGKITGESVLADIAMTAKAGDWFGMSAVKRIQTGAILATVAGNAAVAEVRLEAIRKIDNAEVLLASVMNDSDARNRLAALTRIVDAPTLAKIVRESADADIRLEALKKVTDPSILSDAAKDDSAEAVRLEALSRIDNADVIGYIAENDSSEKVRATAVKKVSDSETLERIARNDPSSAIRLSVVSRINTPSVIFDIVANDPDSQVRAAALKKVGDAAALVRIVRTNSDESIRLSALTRINNMEIVREVAKSDDSSDIRIAAIHRIDDAETLNYIALNDADAVVRAAAVSCIEDVSVLSAIALNDASDSVRLAAVAKLHDEDSLCRLARQSSSGNVRMKAIERIQSPDVLRSLAQNDLDSRVRLAAVQRIGDRSTLVQIAKSDEDKEVRRAAAVQSGDKALLDDVEIGALLKKAERHDGIVIGGFYLGMSPDDALALCQHYFGELGTVKLNKVVWKDYMDGGYTIEHGSVSWKSGRGPSSSNLRVEPYEGIVLVADGEYQAICSFGKKTDHGPTCIERFGGPRTVNYITFNSKMIRALIGQKKAMSLASMGRAFFQKYDLDADIYGNDSREFTTPEKETVFFDSETSTIYWGFDFQRNYANGIIVEDNVMFHLQYPEGDHWW